MNGPSGTPRSTVCVVGCGHVGVVTAACLAELGHRVAGVDIDAGRVARLRTGAAPFLEPGLDGLLAGNLAAGRLGFTTDYDEGLDGAEFVVLCVSTPSTPTGAADLRHVRRAAERIGAAVAVSGARPVIVNKSTAPIGTGETLDALLTRWIPERARRPVVVANPEFLREGTAVRDFFRPDRIVVGSDSAADAARVAELYAGVDAPVICTDLRTAEMIKYVSNAFLATRVSFVNEVARLCESLHVDLDTMLHGVTLDPRVGAAFFQPGIGYGGSCLPKDVAALLHTGDTAGVTMRVLTAVQEANVAQRRHAVNSLRRALGRLDGLTIAAWGATFKGGADDLRESPALDVIALLRNEGARVRLHDPSVPAGSTLDLADVACGSAVDAARDADAVAVLADWPEFRAVDLRAVRAVMAGDLLYDGRNLLRRPDVEAAGLTYLGVGRPAGRVAAGPTERARARA
jgi:UDPglucose 6-dehydrogenase